MISEWLVKDDGQVAIYDATNITVEIRSFVLHQLPPGVTPIFLEVCFIE